MLDLGMALAETEGWRNAWAAFEAARGEAGNDRTLRASTNDLRLELRTVGEGSEVEGHDATQLGEVTGDLLGRGRGHRTRIPITMDDHHGVDAWCDQADTHGRGGRRRAVEDWTRLDGVRRHRFRRERTVMTGVVPRWSCSLDGFQT